MMRWRILALGAATAIIGLVAPAGPAVGSTASNGQIVFGRFDPAVGDQVAYTVNPDGTGLHQVIPGEPTPGQCPHWSPDGTRIVTCSSSEGVAARIIDPDTGSFRELAMPDPTVVTPCFIWSPDARRLACEGFGATDPSRNGIYTIRVTDGRGLRRVTSNPDGDDLPGDYSPDGAQLVFGRTDPTRPEHANGAIFVVGVDGTGLRRITPWSLGACCWSNWSPNGQWILLSGGGRLYVVHPDGSGLKPLRLDTGGSAYAATEPSWSPDGTMIVFSLLLADNGEWDVYTSRADGTGLTQVTHALPGASDLGEGDEVPNWGTHPLGG